MARLTLRRRGAGYGITQHSRLGRSRAWAIVIGALLLTFVLDRVTASAPVQHLYYLPIILAAISLGWRGSLMAAVAAVLLYHLANPFLLTFRYGESDLVQIALFIAVGLVTAKLTDDARRLHVLAMTDDLTGLHNLRSFAARLKTMVRGSRERRSPLSVLVLDVDRLKSLNDTYGHSTGADAVRTVGHILAARLPAEAVACRYGGDEFVVAIPDRSQPEAESIAEDLCRTVEAAAPMLAGRPFAAATLSVSVGVACLFPAQHVTDAGAGSDAEVAQLLFRAADLALYSAKGNGRNQVSVADLSSSVGG
jgi:diguanylate cyclase (GGDEF)-like protein